MGRTGATATVTTAELLTSAFAQTSSVPGPWVIVAKMEESPLRAKPPLDCVFIKQRFMAAIGSEQAATRGRPIDGGAQ